MAERVTSVEMAAAPATRRVVDCGHDGARERVLYRSVYPAADPGAAPLRRGTDCVHCGLFTKMYGFPLTIYLLSAFFGIEAPLDHISGHLGFLIQWPTLPTLLLWPFAIRMYVGLARREEQDVMAQYPEAYRAYRRRTPAFVPRLGRRPTQETTA